MSTKAKLALSAALILALCGAAMAYDDGDNDRDDGGNKAQPARQTNPGGGNGATAKHMAQPHGVKPHVKK
jgi:hypothetical protein